MGSPLAQFYGSDRAASAIGTRSDLVFHASTVIDSTISTPQIVALSPIGAGIDLGRLPGSVAAYLSIKEAVVSTRKSPSFSDKHRSPAFQSFNQSVPNNASPQIFTYLFNTGNPTFFNRIQLFSIPNSANFQVDFIQARPHGGAIYFDTLTQYTGNAASVVNAIGPSTLLTQFFDPLDGLFNLSNTNVGFDVEIAITNTTGATQNISGYFWGSTYAFDWTQLLVQYVDWYGQSYNVGIFDDRAFSQPFGLGQKIPHPITNENQSNFGSLSFLVLGSNSFFNTQYTYDVILNASLEYQLG